MRIILSHRAGAAAAAATAIFKTVPTAGFARSLFAPPPSSGYSKQVTTCCSPPSSFLFSFQREKYTAAEIFRRNTASDANELEHNFWRKPRSQQEIVDFISDAVFSNLNEENESFQYDQHPSAQQMQQQDHQSVEVISAEPPLVIVHGFLEEEHCDEIINSVQGPDEPDHAGEESTTSNESSENSSGNQPVLQRSTMGSDQETSKHRTSSTAWLREEHFQTEPDTSISQTSSKMSNNTPSGLPNTDYLSSLQTSQPETHPTIQALRTISTRTSNLCGLPPRNMENLQVVRYDVGQEFKMHTDHLEEFNGFDCGGRLATCLIYLNDCDGDQTADDGSTVCDVSPSSGVDEPFTGGETFFHHFDVAIPPKKGSAVFFWNTIQRPGSDGYSSDMFLNVDEKLRHAGLPVLSGEKWIANRWIHPVDFGAGVRGIV